DQDNPRWQRDLFYAEAAMSRLLDRQGQQEAASAHRLAAAAAGRKAMEAFPADTALRQELAQLD
ncbi:MAG TPA: hypothetical protein VN838_00145, partial [Bradyrhizobium sp.]|nr:hypothetical protein [Bradyrhizobium sp.]